MQHSEQTAKLFAALVNAHKEIKTIGFDATNPFFKSKYASLTAILEAIRPILSTHGLALVQGSGATHFDATGMLVAVDVSCMLVHESGEWWRETLSVPVDAEPIAKGSDIRRPTPQTLGSAVSYGRRYLVALVCVLASDEDTDGNHPERDPRKQAPKAETPPKPKSEPKPEADPHTPIGTAWDGTDADAHSFLFPIEKSHHYGKPMGSIPVEDLAKFVAWAGVKPQYIHLVNRANMLINFGGTK